MARATRFDATVSAPFGVFGVRTGGGAITALLYLPRGTPAITPANALAERAVEQVLRYVDDPDYRFDLPLARAGTDFQRRVWQGISAVPPGKLSTYGALSQAAGGTPRAVGQACGDNPYPLVVPCHRIVSAKGLGGFAHASDPDSYQLVAKRWLLQHEGALLI
ncbi:MAG: methylated-DNA--[protein]-cysteine S-methyltransferase [Candidatus Protistobacter heckmanni]|nr:methylated-DNA--[protein]-cysteine S-methyltransferase [Candidatus Protistobacter heckmanni]